MRKKKQLENVKKKEEQKEENKRKSLAGMKKEENDENNDGKIWNFPTIIRLMNLISECIAKESSNLVKDLILYVNILHE